MDTFHVVSCLENASLSRGQARTVAAAMDSTMRYAVCRSISEMKSSHELDCEFHLYKSALSELATELRMLRQSQITLLRREISQSQHELDVLRELLREAVASLKTEIAIDLTNRSTEIREDKKRQDIFISNVTDKLSILCAELRRSFEAMKFESTRDVLLRTLLVVVVAVCAVQLSKIDYSQEKDDNSAQDLEK